METDEAEDDENAAADILSVSGQPGSGGISDHGWLGKLEQVKTRAGRKPQSTVGKGGHRCYSIQYGMSLTVAEASKRDLTAITPFFPFPTLAYYERASQRRYMLMAPSHIGSVWLQIRGKKIALKATPVVTLRGVEALRVPCPHGVNVGWLATRAAASASNTAQPQAFSAVGCRQFRISSHLLITVRVSDLFLLRLPILKLSWPVCGRKMLSCLLWAVEACEG